MANMIEKTSYPNNPKQIMLADSQMVSFPVVVSNTGVDADSHGKKILRAGTPLTGDIEARNTAFTKDTVGTSTSGILLHDVDVTNGNNNGVIVLFGFVDLEKLDTETFKLITDGIKTALAGKIWFLTGSGTKRTEE